MSVNLRPQQITPRFRQRLPRELRGCGCAIVVAAIIGALVFAVWWYFLREKGPRLPEPSGGEMKVVMLDVGQGDSILVVSPAGKAALVDAGEPGDGKKILEALARHGVKQIDLLIATHAHADHIGAADEIIRATNVGEVWHSGVPNTTKNFEDFLKAVDEKGLGLVRVEPGRLYDLGGGAVIKVLAPVQPLFTKEQVGSRGNEPNANSIVARLDYGQFSMLLTGDAESLTEERLMREGANIKARVLKVGHHGSRYATSPEFIKEGGFEYALISCGEKNEYGHPNQDVLKRLRDANVKVFRTDLHGEIVITTRGESSQIKPEREAKSDVWAGREAKKSDTTSSGFIDIPDNTPPPRPTPGKRRGSAGGK